MEKHKYDLNKSAEYYKIYDIEGEYGVTIKVRSHIPYEEKENMARELAERAIMIHEDSCVYISPEIIKLKMYYVAKYYTNIDTDGCTENEIADFLINTELWHEIMSECREDYCIVKELFDAICASVKQTYEDDRSITKALRTSFSFLFNGEDITESLAKAEAMKNTVYNAINAWRKVEKEKEENIDNGTLKFGGNVINFATKKTE